MEMMKKHIGLILMVCLLVSCGPKKTFVTIGTGGVTGVYYPTGGAIARIINKNTTKIKATVESTAGSVYNINAVLNGDLDIGIAQSDRQYQAINGLAEWKNKGPQKNLYAIASLHAEAITLIASEKSGIRSIKHLKGKRINIGHPGSGHRENSIDVLTSIGLTKKHIKAETVKPVEAPGLLQNNQIDAFFYTVGHPNGAIKESTAGRRKVRIIPITGASIDRLIQQKPYYTKTTILKSYYPKALNTQNIDTIGVRATLVTSKNTSTELIYTITKLIFEHLETLKAQHPSLSNLEPSMMLTGLSAPLHPGAKRYYKEMGYID